MNQSRKVLNQQKQQQDLGLPSMASDSEIKEVLPVSMSEWETFISSFDNFVVADGLKTELFPDADPEIDIKRMSFKVDTSLATIISTLKNNTGDKKNKGQNYRAAKNLILAAKFLTLTAAQRKELSKLPWDIDSRPIYLTANTFRCYWEYLGTQRFIANLKYIASKIKKA